MANYILEKEFVKCYFVKLETCDGHLHGRRFLTEEDVIKFYRDCLHLVTLVRCKMNVLIACEEQWGKMDYSSGFI